MEGNIAELGQYIGVGLTAFGMGFAALGVGNVAGPATARPTLIAARDQVASQV